MVRSDVYNKKEPSRGCCNGFQLSLPERLAIRYTAFPNDTPDPEIFDETGFNEYGVSISATVSASTNILQIQKVVLGTRRIGLDHRSPLVWKPQREEVELIKIVEEKGATEEYCDHCR